METGVLTRDDILRRALFIPCETKEALGRWIRVYLHVDLPDAIVSEESNSSPIDMMWEIYDKARKNDDENFSRVMAYATRGGFKTLGASILEILNLLHLRRNIGHMAATKDQSERSQEYVRDFLNKPYIRDFKLGDNKKRVEIVRYHDPITGNNITQTKFDQLTEESKSTYTRYSNFIQIVICSLQGANGLHSEFFCVDELDTVDGERVRGYKESKNIPKARDGLMPITLLTSTRKFSYGLVQKELDRAHKSGMHVRHWNVIDITAKCLPDRHKPDLPKVDLYINDDSLEVLEKNSWEALDEKAQEKFYKKEGFAGCVKCPLFAACKGRLATHQTSNSAMLSPIGEIIGKFKDQSVEDVITQLLCRKPSSAGLIYSRFNREVHMRTAEQMSEMITGKVVKNIGKKQLMDLCFQNGAEFFAGMDFGFTHNFAVVAGAMWGRYMLILDVISIKGLELEEQISICKKLLQYNTKIFADKAYPQHITTFNRRGFNMRDWDKGPGSLKAGIEVVRMKIKPASGEAEMFFLKGDGGCEYLGDQLESYHYVTDAAGEVTEDPDKVNDDEMDALRYMVMNVFAPKGKVRIERDREQLKSVTDQLLEQTETPTVNNWMKDKIDSLVGETNPEDEREPVSIKKGKFFFDG